jgi:uncharacterized lipoprotein
VIMSQSTRARAWRGRFGTLALLCLVAGLAGCSKKDEKKSSAKTTTEQQSDTTDTPAAVKPPESNIPDEQIPTEEDYEGEVEKQIKPDSNLPAELDKIEKEIGN